ncbi:MAG: hypothetical protein IJG63_08505 [Oscillospiraceae bacterium]|nr:hypothetical protein [Oscillospiraceae bacterium]
MRKTDEQLRIIMDRSENLKKKRNDRRVLTLGALASCACLALIAAVSMSLPAFFDGAAGNSGRYGSLILSTPGLGYVIIGVLAFLLGICVTLMCVHLSRRGRGSDKP